MKLLITGGFGYVGGRLAQFFASQSHHSVLLGSRKQAGPPSWLPQAEVAQIFWESPDRLAELCQEVDAIIHLAGVNAQDCVIDPVQALKVNALNTANLLYASIQQKVKRFIYLSTAHVYCSPLTGKITEQTCPINLHPYATSHRAGEDVVRAAHQRKEIEGIVVRLSNSFGAPANKDPNCWMLLVNDLCRQAVNTGRMVLQSSGLQRRDFITLTDTCRAIRHLLELSVNRLGDGVFNVGSHWSPTILEMTQHIADRVHAVIGKRPEIVCPIDQNIQNGEGLEYAIAKLLNTGFTLDYNNHIDQEIDELLKFCLTNF